MTCIALPHTGQLPRFVAALSPPPLALPAALVVPVLVEVSCIVCLWVRVLVLPGMV